MKGESTKRAKSKQKVRKQKGRRTKTKDQLREGVQKRANVD